MDLQSAKGRVAYIDMTSGWTFIQASSKNISIADKHSIFDCKIQETDRNTFLVKTNTNVIKEYTMNEISCVTYHIK